jgi:hypothetical protein
MSLYPDPQSGLSSTTGSKQVIIGAIRDVCGRCLWFKSIIVLLGDAWAAHRDDPQDA